jgi:hypothetical protein
MFGKARVVVQTQNKIYYDDGRVEDRKRLIGNYIIIEVVNKEGYRCSENKPSARIRYVFQLKEDGKKTKYCYTSHLNTQFLRFVVSKLKGVENFLLKISPNLGILFFGDETIVIRAENENELIENAKLIVQGADFEIVDFNEIYPLILNKAKNPIPFIVVALILGMLGYFVYDNYFNTPPPPPSEVEQQTTENILQQQQQEEQPKVKTLPYEETVFFLQSIEKLNLPIYLFVSDIDFSSKGLYIGSYIPLPNFRKRGNFYAEVVVAKDKIDKVLEQYHKHGENYFFNQVVGNYKKCLDYMNSKFPILQMGQNYVVYTVSGSWDVDKANDLLQTLQYCPVAIEGTISFEDLLHRSLSLKITLFSPNVLNPSPPPSS